jgi:hypothetical protein
MNHFLTIFIIYIYIVYIMNINPNHQNIQINLRSDDPQVQGSTIGDSELDFQFSRIIEIPPNYVVNISANEVEIPHTYYTFSTSMKWIVEWEDVATGVGWRNSIFLPRQHYTPCLLIKIYNDSVEAFKKESPTVGNIPILTFDCNKLKFDFCSPNYQGFDFFLLKSQDTVPLDIVSNKDALMWCRFWGVNKDVIPSTGAYAGVPTVNIPDATSPAQACFESPNCVDCSRYHNIYLTLGNNLTTDSIDSLEKSNENCLAKIPVNAPFGSLISYYGDTKDSYIFRGLHFGRLSLALRDHEGDLINLNGVRFNISILVQFVKKDYDVVRDLPHALPLETHDDYKGFTQDYIDQNTTKSPDKKRRLTRTFNTKKFVADIRKILGSN